MSACLWSKEIDLVLIGSLIRYWIFELGALKRLTQSLNLSEALRKRIIKAVGLEKECSKILPLQMWVIVKKEIRLLDSTDGRLNTTQKVAFLC